MAKAPDYQQFDSMSGASDSEGGEDAGEKKLSPMLSELGSKLGFTEEQAQALKDFISECQANGYDSGE